ncbi:protein yellow isoform X1 [Diabrotica virgifera virgifera]|uniref:Protein yellow-like n=2 Tax=Diabrotica virgifera virgifera TaxID=50390 RepID=A0ABM5KN77_DIAVI|nr:protein yellow isoform X1 [Diabrotica virgifera virgifera]XP_028134443.2 protein yellow isoform X1 [Diabrotica virgifera virgifera]XP_028134444.2 protein yellow isoform X1 [Diabrotica virgifera virgifera]XP_050511645.1 protein yellow isoform X1 [Diabrotica virgifera virgifera]
MVTTENWFQNWHPPTTLFTEQQPFQPIHFQNSSPAFEYGYQLSQNSPNVGPNSFLTYLVSLSMVKPPGSEYIDNRASRHSTRGYGNRNQLINLETTGPFKTWYYWNVLDFAYPSETDRDIAIQNEDFIPKNNLPLGVEVYGNRIFVSMPKWKPGVPATLAVIPRVPKEPSPKLVPYPNWEWHTSGGCESITSVFRVDADTCGRLWVLDSGLIHVTVKPQQVCPPKILVFDLKSDELLVKYELPEEFIKQDSLYSNIIVDVRDDCDNVYAYLADVWRYGIVVFSLTKMRSWRVTDHLFYPEPLAAAYKVHHLDFEWTDGIFGMSLSPYNPRQPDRILYFNPMSSFREFYVQTSVIRNETGWSKIKDAFRVIGQSRGKSGHMSASRISKNGIMFYNLVTRDSVGCWDIRKPYKRSNLGVVAQDPETMVFPNDLKIDKERRQSVWVISNKLPFYLYEGLDPNNINFRIMSAYVDEASKNTICDPNFSYYDTYNEYFNDEDCY